MDEMIRKTKLAVTLFPYITDTNNVRHFLLLKRSQDKSVDPGLINGVGGKVEALSDCENMFQTAIRELREETGIFKQIRDLEFCGTIHLIGGYKDDWVCGFFKIPVNQSEFESITSGTITEDGELFWVTEDEIMELQDKMIPDLPYVMPDILVGDHIFAFTAFMGEEGKSVERYTLDRVKR